ncbi:hypothetical protein [Bacillus kwashiorkori]|uniref:hypothetical protein n=1 Tax=Bacillus kwashiorkori TaxID=1522318 RepID=UPI000784718C|nr:hypothetical protein [Bacillus kwashiorkori]
MENKNKILFQILQNHPGSEPSMDFKNRLKKNMHNKAASLKRKQIFVQWFQLVSITIIPLTLLLFAFSSTGSEIIKNSWSSIIDGEKGFNKDPNDKQKNTVQEENNKKDEVKVKEESILKLDLPTKGNIEMLLEKVSEGNYSWSFNERMVVFTYSLLDENNFGDLFLWTIGEREPRKIEGVNGSPYMEYIWSPDNEFVLVVNQAGTSVVKWFSIVSVANNQLLDSFNGHEPGIWSPDSKMLAFNSVNEMTDQTNFEFTLDIVIYKISTGEFVTLLEGTDELYYVPQRWVENNKLEYLKGYNNINKKFDYLEIDVY